MRSFGVYPLAAHLTSAGALLAAAPTLLPFWPGKAELRQLKPLAFGWVWPLIDTPQRAACPALLSDELAASVTPGGRLASLLAAGQGAAGRAAPLTWAIDPALLSDVAAMTKPYRVGGGTSCFGTQAERPSRAAAAWLQGVRAVAARQDFFVTPYADTDLAALAHKGLDAQLSAAFADGRAAALKILRAVARASPAAVGQLAWPAGGAADYGVLRQLAADQVRAVILDSKMMPAAASVSFTPSAVATTPDGLGTRMNVLLADHGLTQILGQRRAQIPGVSPGPAPMPAGVRARVLAAAAFGKEQWFLAETAMIAAEAPATARAVVAAPPRRWDPALSTAEALLAETGRAPWLHAATLAAMVAAGPPGGQPGRQPPPSHQVSPQQLGGSLLRQARALDDRRRLLDSILAGGRGYLSTAVDAVESSAWRGGRAIQRPAGQLARRGLAFVQAQLRQVRIVGEPRVTLGGKAGAVPVSVRNGLARQVTVALHVTAPPQDHVAIGSVPKTIKVPGRQQVTVRIPVQAAAAGSTTLTLSLRTPEGRALPGRPTSLTVTATHFGTLAIVIISVALVVFVLSATTRAIRRGGPGDGTPGAEAEDLDPMPDPASAEGEPGSVGSGSADERQTAREDDEHATAPGRADR
jgi:hypothetical protein